MAIVSFYKQEAPPESGRTGEYYALVQSDSGVVIHQAVLPVGGEWEEFPGGLLFKWVYYEFKDGFGEAEESEVPKPLPEEFKV